MFAKSKKKKQKELSGVDIDWYLISIATLRRYGLLILLVIGAVGVYVYLQGQKDPAQRAQTAISDARALAEEFARSPALKDFRSDYDRAQARLREAQSLFDKSDYAGATAAAVDSQAISQAAMAGGGEPDAQFLTVEGEVSFQKRGGGSDWQRAEAKTALYNGDWVKTGGNSSAELMFSNGSLYTIGQNALLEIYSMVNPTTSRKQNTVTMRVGSIEVNTDDDVSTVRTPGTQVVVESKSTTQVGVDPGNKTQVLALVGGASLTPLAGGTPVKVTEGERVSASSEGSFSVVVKSVPPPPLKAPLDNQVFAWDSNAKIELTWDAQPGANGYLLEVSRSRLFSSLEITARRTTTKATVRPTTEGAFYWRVASIEPDGQPGPYSNYRRFRVVGSGSGPTAASALGDKVPPVLKIKKPFKLGSQYYLIEGTAEPGATILVNDEEADADTAGAFRKFISLGKIGWNTITVKAVDAAGNATIERAEVFVEE